jgi:hypothetical protein
LKTSVKEIIHILSFVIIIIDDVQCQAKLCLFFPAISTEAVLYHTGDGHGSPLPHNCREFLKEIGKKRPEIVTFVKDQILYIYNKLHISRTKLIKAKLIDMKAAASNEEKDMFILPTESQIKRFIGNYTKKSAQPFDYGALYAELLEKSKEVEGDSNTNRHIYQVC